VGRTVTALVPDVRGNGVVVHLDGASFALIAASDMRALGLAEGAVLAPAAVAEIERRAELLAARLAALRILAYRSLPSGEIARRLVRKGHLPAVAREAVLGLVEGGVINDEEFARHYVRTRAQRFRYGPGRLARDLRRLGIGEEAARKAVAGTLEQDGVDPRRLLAEAAARKLRTLQDLDGPTRRRRLKTYLLRRGFAAADVIEVVKETLAG
jgi:regulatory protein